MYSVLSYQDYDRPNATFPSTSAHDTVAAGEEQRLVQQSGYNAWGTKFEAVFLANTSTHWSGCTARPSRGMCVCLRLSCKLICCSGLPCSLHLSLILNIINACVAERAVLALVLCTVKHPNAVMLQASHCAMCRKCAADHVSQMQTKVLEML